MNDDDKAILERKAAAVGSIVTSVLCLLGVHMNPESAQVLGTVGIIVAGALPSWLAAFRKRL